MQMLMNNPLALMSRLRSSNNPMDLMQNMFGDNPLFNRAMAMTKGKNEQQIEQTVRNMARQMGMSDEDLQNFVSQFGLRL